MAMTVARVKHLSSADVKACVRNSTPIIATETLKSWRASTLWSFDYLKQNYGSDVVTLSDGSFRALARMPLARCIDLILGMDLGETYKYGDATPYIQDWVVLDLHPELYDAIEVPEWFNNWERSFRTRLQPRKPYHDIVVLAGPAGATTYVHRDRHHTHAWLAQIVGRKKWTIFRHPDQYALLNNRKAALGAPAFVEASRIRIRMKFPGFRQASPIEFVLEPGELVFVPSGWIHQVTSLDPSLSVSGNYVDGSNIAVFLRDACAETLETFRQRRRRLPPQLVRHLPTLAQTIEGGKLGLPDPGAARRSPVPGKAATCADRQPRRHVVDARPLRARAQVYELLADRRADLEALGLNASGQAAVQTLLSVSSRREIRVVVGMSTANVALYGPLHEDVDVAHHRVVSALRTTRRIAAPRGRTFERGNPRLPGPGGLSSSGRCDHTASDGRTSRLLRRALPSLIAAASMKP